MQNSSICSFRELVSFFGSEYRERILDYIFLSSNRVFDLNTYSQYLDEKIDFQYSLRAKEISKLKNISYPLNRLTKSVFFCNSRWILHDDVFIPRNETEDIVEIVRNWLIIHQISTFSYLDICTGSGVLCLSIYSMFVDKLSKIGSVDISVNACSNTMENLQSILSIFENKNKKVDCKIYLSDWTKFVYIFPDWEIITINPPYVCGEEFNTLSDREELRKYDPKRALVSDNDGWDHYAQLLRFLNVNQYWKFVVAECNSAHEVRWDGVIESEKRLKIRKYRDYLGKFRFVSFSRW